jgi:hypothetical protein
MRGPRRWMRLVPGIRTPGEFLRAENRAGGSAARCIRVALTAGTRYGDVASVTYSVT